MRLEREMILLTPAESSSFSAVVIKATDGNAGMKFRGCD